MPIFRATQPREPSCCGSPTSTAVLPSPWRHWSAKTLRPPDRFAAIHATELYLSALLLHFGDTPAVVRELRHDLVARTDRALARGLVLRRRTDAHLRTMAASHEYQISRYAPELGATLSQVNRLAATLEEVAAKTRAIICEGESPTKMPGRPGVSSGSSKAA